MDAPATVVTRRPNVTLRELTVDDAQAYFEAVDASRDHLNQFSDQTSAKYPTLESVRKSIENPSNPRKLRFGIWDGETFVGSVNLTPDDEDAAEVGYWLDGRHTGKGYATLATQALANHVSSDYSKLYASVAEGNDASEAVLERVGFELIAREVGYSVFCLLNSTVDGEATKQL